MGLREDNIAAAIKNLSGGEFERFALRVLRAEEYGGLNPTSEGADLGEDARTESTTLMLHGGKRVSLFASKTATLAKLKKDCSRAKSEGRIIDIVVFATSGDPQTKTQKEWAKQVKKEFNWELVVHTIRYFSVVAAADKHASLVDDYLNIPPPGGDYVHEIEAVFALNTDRALRGVVQQIAGISVPRDEVASIEDQFALNRNIIFTGDAGTGKSDVGARLAKAARAEGKCVLFLDARDMDHVHDVGSLSQYLNLKGSVASAVGRVARVQGCRVIVDQLDNAVGGSAGQLIELALSCGELPSIEVIVISRKREAHEGKLLSRLAAGGFIELTSHQLSEAKVIEMLGRLGIEASGELTDLGSNLLNLSLIASIKSEQLAFDFSVVVDEVDLWERFLEALIEREGTQFSDEQGERLVAEAIRLAKEGLKSHDRTVNLSFPRSPEHKRLVSWQVLTPVNADDAHRFRHEKLQDFLAAWGAVRLGAMPAGVLAEHDVHRARNVLVWMDKLYEKRRHQRRKQFLEELFADEVGFYTRAAVIDRYAHSTHSTSDTETLPIILAALKRHEELRIYFFRSRPNPAWVPVLWKHRFFDTSPEPQRVGDRFVLPWWTEQDYLASVAADVPEFVVMHARSLRDETQHMFRALDALCRIPGDIAETAVPQVISWLCDDFDVRSGVVGLITHLTKEKRFDGALQLFHALTAPRQPQNAKEIHGCMFNGEAVALFGDGFLHDELPKLFEVVAEAGIDRVVAIVEEHLCEAVRIEMETRNVTREEVWASWRDPLAEPEPYSRSDYKDELAKMLRRLLEKWVETDAHTVEPLIQRYLGETDEMLRRLALHLLQKYPAKYKRLVVRELTRVENLGAPEARDEFLNLIKNGSSYLKPQQLTRLIGNIRRGFNATVERRLKGKSRKPNAAVDAMVSCYERRWMRDRLAMLEDHLQVDAKQFLESLIEEEGEPYCPGKRRMTEVYPVNETSPLTSERMASMSIRELIAFLEEWQPEPEQHGRTIVSFDGLAMTLADEVLSNPAKYSDYLVRIALLRYQYARVILDRLTNTQLFPLPWEEKLGLCEVLLADDTVCTDMARIFDGGWTGTRQSMVRLIETWLDEAKNPIPREFLPRVRALLLILIDDPDPRPEDDKPLKDGMSEDRNPTVIALNHVRPSAISALIDYARYVVILDEREAGGTADAPPRCLEPVVREALSRKLNLQSEPSRSVRAVFGRHIGLLHALDEEWFGAHLNLMLPEGKDEETKWLFAAAWDAYLRYDNTVYLTLVRLMRGKYMHAIDNLSGGCVTRTSTPPARDLAGHLIIEYLSADYELHSQAGQESLIAHFYRRLSPSEHGEAAFSLWRACNHDRKNLDVYWVRACALWQWRIEAAAQANHTPEFDAEMNWLAHLMHLAAGRESLASLWNLLEGVLPHIARSDEHSSGWRPIEEYLAAEVERDPSRTIRFYYLMHAQRARRAWLFYANDKARKIVEIAAATPESRRETLDFIDMLGRSKNYQFQDVYERYSI